MTNSAKPLGEFDLIERFFKERANQQLSQYPEITLGIGDDCALIGEEKSFNSNNLKDLAISTDMLVEGRHFLPNADPYLLGHKCLAVNLSDLAAMGARPLGFTLAIAMPAVNAPWLEAFSNGLFDLAKQHQCPLIGGDTTAGPLTISITIFGRVSGSQALARDRAQVGDDIWVSHQVGDARLALGAMRLEWPLAAEELDAVAKRMHAPTPRVELGQNLLGVAHAAIDISDGLLGDLSHILRQSNVSAEVFIDQVPGSAVLNNKSLELQRLCKLMGGDDYELCFTAAPDQSDAIHALSKKLGISLTAIGKIKPASSQSIELIDGDGHLLPENLSAQYLKSFDHFK